MQMSKYSPLNFSSVIQSLEDLDLSPVKDIGLDDLDPDGNFSNEIRSKSRDIDKAIDTATDSIKGAISDLYSKIEEDFQTKLGAYIENRENEEESFPFDEWFESLTELKQDVRLPLKDIKYFNPENELDRENIAHLTSHITKTYSTYSCNYVSHISDIVKDEKKLINLLSLDNRLDMYTLLMNDELADDVELKYQGCAIGLYSLLIKYKSNIARGDLSDSTKIAFELAFKNVEADERATKYLTYIVGNVSKKNYNDLYTPARAIDNKFLFGITPFIENEDFLSSFLNAYKNACPSYRPNRDTKTDDEVNEVMIAWRFKQMQKAVPDKADTAVSKKVKI